MILESKEGYEFLVNHSKEIILVLSKRGKIIFANKSTLTIFGYSKEEITGLSITHFLTKNSIKKALYALAQEFLGRPQPELEVQAKTKSGEIRYLSVSEGSAPIHKNGKLMGMMISANDIAGRRRAEKERQEAEKRFRDLWENAPVAYHTVDTKGIVTNANQTEANMLGYAKEELVGKSIFEFILPEQRAEAATRFQQKIFGHRILRAENRIFVKKDGSKINVAIDDSLERDEDGKVIGIRMTLVDITQLKVADESLKKSEEHFRALVEKSGIAISTDDDKGNLRYCNSRYADIFGYSMEEMRSQPISSIVHSDDVERVMLYHRGRLQGKDVPSRYEFKGIRKDGSVIYLEVDVVVLREGERLIGTRSYMWDITERKQAEANLRESEKRYRELFDHVPVGLYRTTPGGKILDANPALLRMLGCPDRESMLKGNTATDYANPKDRERWKTALEKNGVLEDFENKIFRQDGKVIWVKDSARVVKDNKGRVLYYEGALVDFTERKQAEEELRKSEERFKLIFEYAPDAYYLNDLKGNFIDGNKAAENIMGYKKEELIGGSFLKLKVLSLDQLPKAAKLLAKNAMGMATGPDEFILKRKSGDKVAVEISTHPVKFDNRTVVLGIARDITERMRSKGMLVKSEKRFRELSELLPQIVFETDIKGNLTFSNHYGIKSLGYSLEDFQSGINIFALIAPEDREIIKTRLKEILSGSETASREFQVMRKDGGKFPILMHANAILEGGVPIGIRGIAFDITERKKAEKKLGETLSGLRNALGGIIQVLSATIEKRDPYTAGHQRRVADLARAIGQEMGITADRVEGLRIAGIIHDIGKVSIPAEILIKPTRLTEIEYKLIQSHPEVGHDILRDIDFAWPLAEMVLQHHERMNGSGYPNQLKGEEILLEARILAVSDVVEAMASHRPYRPALGIEAALEEIEKNKGVFYDPDVVSACLTLFREKGFEFK